MGGGDRGVSHANGTLSPEELDVFQEDETAPALLSRTAVQRERLRFAVEMVGLFERDLSPKASKQVRLLVTRVMSDLGVLSLLHGKKW